MSITALSDFTIADSLDDEPIPEPETITVPISDSQQEAKFQT